MAKKNADTVPPNLPSPECRHRGGSVSLGKKHTAYLALNQNDLKKQLIQCCPFVSVPSPEDPAAVPVAALKIFVLVPSSLAGAGSSFQPLQVSKMIFKFVYSPVQTVKLTAT